MATYNAGFINVTGNAIFDTSGSNVTNFKTTNATVTNMTTNNLTATNFDFNNDLTVGGNLTVGNTLIVPAKQIVVQCKYNPIASLAKWQAPPFLQGVSTPYGCGSYIGQIYAPLNVEYFANIRFGNAPVGALRCFPCVPAYLDPNGNGGVLGFPPAATGPQMTKFLYTNQGLGTFNPLTFDCHENNIPYGTDSQPPGMVEGGYQRSVNKNILSNLLIAVNEDSLMLDIFRPIGSKVGDNLPVIVWVRGGALQTCSRRTYIAGFAKIINDYPDCIVVSLEYRLSILGWSPDEVFRGKTVAHASNAYQTNGGQFAGCCGNQGLTDCIVALQWVQVNIAAFGGDRTNVTLMGHSAGGLILDLLRISPLCLDTSGNNVLFNRSISASGGYNDNSVASIVNARGQGTVALKNLTPVQWGNQIDTYNSIGNSATGTLQNFATNQQNLYASFGYGKLVKYVDTSGYLITSPTGAYTKDSSGNNILVLDSSGNIVFPTINYNITTGITTVAKNLANITMSYGWYVDNSGLVHKDNYVNSSGFATYIAAMSTDKAKYMAFDLSTLIGVEPSLVNTVVAAQGSDLYTAGNFYRPTSTQTLDFKSIAATSFTNAIGSNPEKMVDASGNNILIKDIPVIYTSMTDEVEYYDVSISQGYYNTLSQSTGPFNPGYYFNTTIAYPAGLSYMQFDKGSVYRKHFAKIAPFYGIAGNVRPNQSVSWVDPLQKAIDGSGAVTEIIDIFDAYYAPFINAVPDASGTLSTGGMSLRFPWATGMGYTLTDSSDNIPLQFYKAPFITYFNKAIDTSGAVGYATVGPVTYPVDASGNSTQPLDASGNPVTNYTVTGFVITSCPEGYYNTSRIPLPFIKNPVGTLPIFPLDYSLLPYYEYSFNGAAFVFENCQQTVAIQMDSDIWSFGCFDNALRSADGPSQAYVASIPHYLKGVGCQKQYFSAGSFHVLDTVLLSNFWDLPVNSMGFKLALAISIYPGSLNQLGGSGYSYTPTAADVSICHNMRNYIHSFIKTGVPTFLPNVATSSGMGYVFNSDSSGNDISGVATVDSFNNGAIGFLMQQFYGLTAAQIAANSSLGGNYYLYPYSNL